MMKPSEKQLFLSCLFPSNLWTNSQQSCMNKKEGMSIQHLNLSWNWSNYSRACWTKREVIYSRTDRDMRQVSLDCKKLQNKWPVLKNKSELKVLKLVLRKNKLISSQQRLKSRRKKSKSKITNQKLKLIDVLSSRKMWKKRKLLLKINSKLQDHLSNRHKKPWTQLIRKISRLLNPLLVLQAFQKCSQQPFGFSQVSINKLILRKQPRSQRLFDWKAAQNIMEDPNAFMAALLGFKETGNSGDLPASNVAMVKKKYLSASELDPKKFRKSSANWMGISLTE